MPLLALSFEQHRFRLARKGRLDRVIEDTAHPADADGLGVRLASDALLRVIVGAAELFILLRRAMPEEAHVSALAPAWAPGVLNGPVVDAIVLAVADQGHCVVDDDVLEATVKDAVLVHHPVRGPNRNRNRTLNERVHQRKCLVGGQRPVCRQLYRVLLRMPELEQRWTLRFFDALLIIPNVGHSIGVVQAVLVDVVHRQLDRGAIAAARASAGQRVLHAVHQLLNREGSRGLRLDLVTPRQHGRRRHCPARTTASLILSGHRR
mmetsp:Transcript_64672/g.140868  ORF Transcript_64672/g.140868 Transcript_64672/m.140868 type:complete len:264 (+) Transcript_64672:110-901(+)